MADPARLLRLLSLFQARQEWTAPELAERLAVTPRTVRRDVTRLRDLGYPVDAAQGPAGGYRLGAGRALPPLLLDDEEAVAVAVSLRRTAGSVTGAGDAAVRTLAKLEQVLPPRLRQTVRALLDATDSLPGPDTSVDADTLLTLARACRDRVRARFDYADLRGATSERLVEPVRLVTAGDRWYLFAWDVDREDWRTFRVDRSSAVTATTWRFPFREHPDPVAHLQRAVSAAPYRHVARVVVDAPAAEVRQRISARSGTVTPLDDHTCELVAGGDDLTWVALYLASLPHRWRVVEPFELAVEAARLGRLLSEAAGNR